MLIIGAASLSFTNAFLWNSQHLYISRAMSEESKSSSIATISIAGQVSSVLAPLLGGVVGSFFGTGYLLGMALIFCLVALVPLRGMGDAVNATTSEKIAYTLSGAPRRDLLANFAFNVETAISVMVWPIYLAVFIASFKNIGAITALAAAAAIVVTWLAGHRGDKGQDRAILKEGVTATSFIDIARIFATSQPWITIVTSAYNASLAYFQNAWASTYYHHAKQRGLQYIMSMEMAGDFAYTAVWGCLLLVLLFSSTHIFFIAAFILSAVFAWGCLLLNRQSPVDDVRP